VVWALVATVSMLAVSMALSLVVPVRGLPGSAYPFKAKPPAELGGTKR
jgi:hypothetical protein